jgi:DNA mismatch endonuclease (patch repair protein)
MADKFSKAVRSKIMSKIKQRDTKPEIALRKALSKEGYRYRLHYGNPKIDIAFVSKKVAVFVDGCFWHMCPKHSHFPKSNRKFWVPKLKRNKARDKKTNKVLAKMGWKVIRIWEHDIHVNTLRCVKRIIRGLQPHGRK